MKFNIAIIALILLGFLSCKKEETKSGGVEQFVLLDKKTVSFHEGSKVVIHPIFGAGLTPQREYTWTSSDPDVVSVEVIDTYSASFTANQPGKAQVTFASTDGQVSAVCEVEVKAFVEDGVTRILAIGNSFSEDALEYYLHGLAQADGEQTVIGNLYIGGASLDLHWQNAQEDKADYEYRKVDLNGNKTNTPNTSIEAAILDEEWDYISFQQASPNSGQYETYTVPLPQLVNYVKERARHPHVKYILHQTWAYAESSTYAGFANYEYDQANMYRAIMDAVQRARDLAAFDLVVPSGTAIQNGRTSFVGDNFNAGDGYHLNANIGRYTASCTWFEALFGKTVVGNPFKPDALSNYEAEMAQQAAHFAIAKPFEVTDMVDYKDAGHTPELETDVLVDFGLSSSAAGWNGLTGFTSGSAIANLKDKDGEFTGISLTVTERFNDQNPDGVHSSQTDFNMPESVSAVSYFGNSKDVWSGLVIEKSTVKLAGLNKDQRYNFCFFGSRNGVSDNRETAYIVHGKNEETALLNTSNNTSNTACVTGIQPDDNGEITITVTSGPNNNNQYGFYYLTAMRISPSN